MTAGNDHGGATGGGDPRRLDLGSHPAPGQIGSGGTRHRFDLGGNSFHLFDELCIRIAIGRRGKKAVNVGEQHQQVGPHHRCDARAQAVIVAITDFGGRNGVVFIDHRNGPEFQQRCDCRTCVEIAAPLFGIAEGQQNLASREAAISQHL